MDRKKISCFTLRSAHRYLNSPTNSCSQNDKDEMLFLILVHSRPEDLEHRQLVRETWGSVRSIKGKRIKTVFVMGRPREQEPRAKTLRRFDFNHVSPTYHLSVHTRLFRKNLYKVALMVMATRLLRGRSIEGQTAAGVKTGKKKVEDEDGLQGKRQREQPPAARGSEQEKLDSEALLFGDILQGVENLEQNNNSGDNCISLPQAISSTLPPTPP